MLQQMLQRKSSERPSSLDIDIDIYHPPLTPPCDDPGGEVDENPPDPSRDALLSRIRGFHISTDNAKGLLAGAEAKGLSLAELEAVLNQATAQNADRDRLRVMVAETLEAKHPPQDWKGGISEHVHTSPAETWERVLTRLRGGRTGKRLTGPTRAP